MNWINVDCDNFCGREKLSQLDNRRTQANAQNENVFAILRSLQQCGQPQQIPDAAICQARSIYLRMENAIAVKAKRCPGGTELIAIAISSLKIAKNHNVDVEDALFIVQRHSVLSPLTRAIKKAAAQPFLLPETL